MFAPVVVDSAGPWLVSAGLPAPTSWLGDTAACVGDPAPRLGATFATACGVSVGIVVGVGVGVGVGVSVAVGVAVVVGVAVGVVVKVVVGVPVTVGVGEPDSSKLSIDWTAPPSGVGQMDESHGTG